jgi:succinoglycan biosynthesis transport protein ExoP
MPANSLADSLALLWRRRTAVALTTGAAVASALLASASAEPLYEAVTEFYVAEPLPAVSAYSSGPAVVAALESVLMPSLREDRLRTQRGLLESEAIRLRVEEAVADGEIHAWPGAVEVAVTRANMLTVRVVASEPQWAARVANAYPHALESFLRETAEPYELQDLERRRSAFESSRENLAAARSELQRFLERSGVPDINGAIAGSLSRRGNLENEIAAARTALRGVEGRIVAAEARLGSEARGALRQTQAGEGGRVEGGRSSQTTRQLGEEIAKIQEQLAVARARAEDERRLQQLGAQLEERRLRLSAQIESIVTRTQRRLQRRADSLEEELRRQIVTAYVERAALEAELAGKTSALELLTQSSDSLPAQRVQTQFLQAELERLQRMTDAAAVAYEEARARDAARSSPLVVVREARTPLPPIFPTPVRSGVLAGALGLLAGIYLAFGLHALEGLQARIRTGSDRAAA